VTTRARPVKRMPARTRCTGTTGRTGRSSAANAPRRPERRGPRLRQFADFREGFDEVQKAGELGFLERRAEFYHPLVLRIGTLDPSHPLGESGRGKELSRPLSAHRSARYHRARRARFRVDPARANLTTRSTKETSVAFGWGCCFRVVLLSARVARRDSRVMAEKRSTECSVIRGD